MKTNSLGHFATLFILFSLLLTLPQTSIAVISTPTTQEVDCSLSLYAPLTLNELAVLDRKDVELRLNKRFTVEERLQFLIVKRTINRATKKKEDLTDCDVIRKKSTHSIIFGVVGFFIVGIILGVFAIGTAAKALRTLKENPDCPDAQKHRNKANLGIILGIIDIIGALIVISRLGLFG